MYTSTVVVSALYLAGMVIVLLLSCCVSMTTCDCVKIATPSAYAGDFFILVGIFWQAAAQSLETPQDLEADTDAAAVGNLLLLALASTLYVVFANSIRALSVTLFAGLVLLRTAAAAVLVYVLLNDTISDAPVTIIMILGVVVVGTFPWLKLRTPKTLDV